MTQAYSLLSDDALIVRTTTRLQPVVDAWLPLHRRVVDAAEVGGSVLVDVCSVDSSAPAGQDASRTDLLRLAGVRVRAVDTHTLKLLGVGAAGTVSLSEGLARIGVFHEADPRKVAPTVYTMLTLSAALLLGRLGAALIHAGAVVDAEGRAWLITGDTHAGKTSTCVALVDAGWRFLADDQVVLRAAEGEILAEGWPRHAHLDTGYDDHAIHGVRGTIDPRERWADSASARAPLHAIVLPQVKADSPTRVRRIAPADAFTALVRQSPWLLADAVAASRVVALLESAALKTGVALELGRDSYGSGALLSSLLREASSDDS